MECSIIVLRYRGSLTKYRPLPTVTLFRFLWLDVRIGFCNNGAKINWVTCYLGKGFLSQNYRLDKSYSYLGGDDGGQKTWWSYGGGRSRNCRQKKKQIALCKKIGKKWRVVEIDDWLCRNGGIQCWTVAHGESYVQLFKVKIQQWTLICNHITGSSIYTCIVYIWKDY
jgi:hypothetical protein